MQNYSEVLRAIVATAIPQLEALSSVELAAKSSPEKWSKQQILGHLIDSAYNNHQRFLRAEAQDNLVFFGYDQNAWVQKNRYQERASTEIIQTWVSVNEHLAWLISSLSPELLNASTTDHNFHIIGMERPAEGQPSSLGYLVEDYLFHLEHHLAQILPDFQRTIPSKL